MSGPKSDDSRVTSTWRPTLASLALYALFACLLAAPLLDQITDRLPLGTEETRTVPLFNLWTIGWNADRLAHQMTDYWNAPIYFPDKNTFAYSEPQPLTMLVAPLVWRGEETVAYNVYLIVSLWLNGCMTHWMLRRLAYGWPAVISGSLMMMSLPIVHWQIGVLQLVPLWGVLWAMSAMFHLQTATLDASSSRTQLARRGIELGLAMAVTSLMAIYHALFLSTLFGVFVLSWGKNLLRTRTLVPLALAAIVCLLLTSPMILPMLQLTHSDEFVRPKEMVEQLSLVPRDYLTAYGHSPWLESLVESDRYFRVQPGLLKLELALFGFIAGCMDVRTRRWTCMLLIIAVAAFGLSCGTHLNIGSFRIWDALTQWVPGFQQVRSPFRYAYFVQIAVALSAAGGIQILWAFVERYIIAIPGVMCRFFLIVVGIAAAVIPFPPVLRLGVVPDVHAASDWTSAVRDHHRQHPGAALCLPMAAGNEVRDFEQTCEWMLYGLQHGVPLVNGYSGYCPDRLFELGRASAEQGLTSEKLAELAKLGVRYFIVRTSDYELSVRSGDNVGAWQLKLLVSSPSGIEVYVLE